MAKKLIPFGEENFKDLIQNNCYYVDKTFILKTLFSDDLGNKVSLIVRPRRFGKTLTMSMIKHFLQINTINVNDTSEAQTLFKDTFIFKDDDFCKRYLGQYPVIFISLKSIDRNNFKSAYQALGSTIFELACNFDYLLDSDKLSDIDRDFIKKLLDEDYLIDFDNSNFLISSLQRLSYCLNKHFDKKVVMLIDEYDVPLAKAASFGYYSSMHGIISSMLNKALKGNDYIQKAILTGCLIVAKESIFTGLNNLSVNSVLSKDPQLASAIGFTQSEVNDLLCYYGISSQSETVKKWYDGYRFYTTEMYCPWDVVNFCHDAIRHLEDNNITVSNYWMGTSLNDVIKDFLGFISGENTDKLQELVDGKSVKIALNENLNYDDLEQHNPIDFWSKLVYTGYLTVCNLDLQNNDLELYEVKIPNEEIRECFIKNVLNYFSGPYSSQYKDTSLKIADYAINADITNFKIGIKNALNGYISIRDTASKEPKENFYHGFLNGLFSNSAKKFDSYYSNTESGNGYADIMFTSATGEIGVIIEIKYSKDSTSIEQLSLNALKQIDDNNYKDKFIKNSSIKKIHAYGICFHKKDCYVALKELS